VVPVAVARSLTDFKIKYQPLSPPKDIVKDPKSFGVFLGSFNNPPTPNQARLLSQWNMIVLDPLQSGVLDALTSTCNSTHILGRLEVNRVVKSEGRPGTAGIIDSLASIAETLDTSFRRRQDTESRFTGVLLAKWETNLPSIIFNELIKYIISRGLEVYLEISPPDFLTEKQCRDIDLGLVSGIVCRNGTILPNGDRRNFFQMAESRLTLRALAAQSLMSGSLVMMWETIDDHVKLDHSVIKRSFTWCTFNSVISWIGPQSALLDTEVAATKSVTTEPMGALMWLKNEELIKAHDIWRLNGKVMNL
jgi:hypothetical protein